MSKENTSNKTSITSQNTETRTSNVDYEEYINSVRGSVSYDNSDVETVKFTPPNAEDEVCAILLSAMVGSIIKDFVYKQLVDRGASSVYSATSKKSNMAIAPSRQIWSPETTRETDQRSSVALDRDTKSQSINDHNISTSNNNFNEAFDNTEEALERKQNNEVTHLLRDSAIQSDESREKKSSILLHKLKELLIYDQQNIYGWEFLESQEEVTITFKQGNRYEGKLLNCRMHGRGKFYWADGSVYEGDFFHGKMTGQGKLYWSDRSWYEGEFCRGYRHGRGLYVFAPTFYAGYWKCGRRHGVGAMFYNHSDTKKDYYNGEWFGDNKHGTGLRSYPSGAMYSGQWKSGKRQGLGTMVWTNRDVYSGNFHKGKMHGYGEYTWDTFYNQQLVVPEENCYYGNWVKNMRHGNGTLETTSGVIVKGCWKYGKKHGPAEVICSNGNFLYHDNLFEEDNLCLPDDSVEVDSLMNASLGSHQRLPVSAASQEINLDYYVNRLVELVNESYAFGRPFLRTSTGSPLKTGTKRTFSFNRSFEPEEDKFEFQEEETHIRNVIMQFLSVLKVIYTTYAQVCCDIKPNFPTILMRLMWWQLLRDCNLHSRGFSLAHFDACIANNKACLVQGVHYPFERLLFWQFLHCLIEVAWNIYVKRNIGTPAVKGVIASALHKLITIDLIPNAGRHRGNALFRCRDLMSLDSIYWYYRGLGEPQSARDFLKNAAVPQEKEVDPNPDTHRGASNYQEYQIRGKNILGVGGKLTYFPKEEPLLTDSKCQEDPSHPKNLSCLSSVGLLAILECVLKVCPSISSSGLLVNMDYKIVFLEFYEILLLCAREKARITILEQKQNEEKEDFNSVSLENNAPEEPSPRIEDVLPPAEKHKQRKKSSGSKKPKKSK